MGFKGRVLQGMKWLNRRINVWTEGHRATWYGMFRDVLTEDREVNDENRRGSESEPAVQRRDWRRVHHSPLFWIGVVLCLAAITIYVLSDDLSWRPRTQ